jgi:hypothetical protein
MRSIRCNQAVRQLNLVSEETWPSLLKMAQLPTDEAMTDN